MTDLCVQLQVTLGDAYVAPDGVHILLVKTTGSGASTAVVHDGKYELRARLEQAAKR